MQTGMARTKNTVRVNYPHQNTVQGAQRPGDTTEESDPPPPRPKAHGKRQKERAQRFRDGGPETDSDDEVYQWQGINFPPLHPRTGGKTLPVGAGPLPNAAERAPYATQENSDY